MAATQEPTAPGQQCVQNSRPSKHANASIACWTVLSTLLLQTSCAQAQPDLYAVFISVASNTKVFNLTTDCSALM